MEWMKFLMISVPVQAWGQRDKTMQSLKELVIGLDHLVLIVVDISAPHNGTIGPIHSSNSRGPGENRIVEPN
jgi:hypothetical protein